MKNVRIGTMGFYDEAREAKKNYIIRRNRGIAEMILYYSQANGETYPVEELARHAGVSKAVILGFFKGDRHSKVDLWTDADNMPSFWPAYDDCHNFHPKPLGTFNVHWNIGEVVTTFAAIDGEGEPDLNNTITKTRYTFKIGFSRA